MMKLRSLLSILLCGALLFTGCARTEKPGSASDPGSSTTPVTPDTPPAEENQLDVQLYLPNASADGFDIVQETLKDDPATLPNQLIAALVQRDALPDGVSVKSFDMTKSIPPQLRLNLSQEFADAVTKTGTAGEYLLMGSVVNTFLTAYDADQIVLTAEGKVIETGHTAYDQPLRFYQDQDGSLFEQCAPDAPDDALAAIINEPFEKSEAAKLLEAEAKILSINLADDGLGGDRAYIVPREPGSSFELHQVEYDDDSGEFYKKSTLYSDRLQPNAAVYGTFQRPEGVPRYMISISAENAYGEFLFAYDGRDGTPPIEYVLEKQ